MKGQRTVKYYVEHYLSNDFGSIEYQITCKEYWNEFNNSKEFMENHNENLDEYEKEYNSYTYSEKKDEYDNYIKITRRFHLGMNTVYLTELRCKPGFKFTRKK